jgi:hypothetical protein
MSKRIAGYDYSGFIDYDRTALGTATPNTKIEWLEYRIKKVQIDPLDHIFPPTAPGHQAANPPEATFNLCGVTLIACAIEGLGHFMTGQVDQNGDSFKAWILQYMPAWNATTPNRVRILDWLWDSARNGLAHQLTFKSGGTEAQGAGRFAEGRDGQIQMDPFVFYSDFKAGTRSYFQDLGTNRTFRTNFENRFRDTLL